ncbi:hypothetical protein [Nonomuraea sp. SYSU D8015]|nr:hypothetical protein [Nonomuraea sp. SYSU D8015]
MPAERRSLSGRLPEALGVPVAVFVAYQLWANLASAARPHH